MTESETLPTAGTVDSINYSHVERTVWSVSPFVLFIRRFEVMQGWLGVVQKFSDRKYQFLYWPTPHHCLIKHNIPLELPSALPFRHNFSLSIFFWLCHVHSEPSPGQKSEIDYQIASHNKGIGGKFHYNFSSEKSPPSHALFEFSRWLPGIRKRCVIF